MGRNEEVAMQSNGKIFILDDFSYDEIDWDILNVHGNESTWRLEFLECVQENNYTNMYQS